jgi:Flp pilus assembly protein CpaB
MRRGRTLILILLILIIGLLVGFVAIRQFLATQQQVDQPVYVSIYFAAQNIPQGAPITEDVLGTMQIPQENVVATMYTVEEKSALLTKAAKYPIDQGTPLTEALVTDSSSAVPTSGPQWAAQIPVGMTAISIPTDRLAVSGYAINDGARVNINACFLFVDVDPSYQTILPNLTAIVTGTSASDGSLGGFEGTGFSSEGLPILSLGVAGSGTPHGRFELDPAVQQPYYLTPSEAQRPRTVCQMILQNVTVMKLGNFPLSGALQAPTQTGNQQQPQQTSPNAPAPDIITLIVTPQDAITLTYLTYTNAKISMTLRNPSDDARVPTEASTLQFLLSQYNIPVPAKLPYAMHPSLDALTSPSLPNDTVTVPSE